MKVFVKNLLMYGSPLILLSIGLPYVFQEFFQVRFDAKKNKNFFTWEEAKKFGIKISESKNLSLEEEAEKLKQMDLDNWENKRGPRDYEEGNVLFKEALQRAKRLESQRIN